MGYGPRGHRESDTAEATSHIRGGKQRLRARAILVLSSSNFPRLSFWGHNTDFCLFVFVYVFFFPFLKWLLCTQNQYPNGKATISINKRRLDPLPSGCWAT